jgi:hypothetical protein
MMEHAAAAAGGSMGALAGKPVGASIGKIFGNVDKATTKAAKAKPETVKPNEHPEDEANRAKGTTGGGTTAGYGSGFGFGPATPGAGMPASGGGVTRQNRTARAAAESPALEPEAAPLPPPVPVHVTTQEEVAAIQAGTVRRDVLAKLGPASSMVTIPDEGHLLEIYKYTSGGRWLGTVRMDNGAVVRVDSAQ